MIIQLILYSKVEHAAGILMKMFINSGSAEFLLDSYRKKEQGSIYVQSAEKEIQPESFKFFSG